MNNYLVKELSGDGYYVQLLEYTDKSGYGITGFGKDFSIGYQFKDLKSANIIFEKLKKLVKEERK